MPRHDYQCPSCAIVFEVSRGFAEADAAVSCPLCAAGAVRLFSAGDALVNRASRSAPSSPGRRGWGGHGHTHGPGGASHRH